MMLAHEIVFVGIDVGKQDCFAAVHGQKGSRPFANSPEGHLALSAWLAGLGGEVRVGLEATGGYEAAVWEHLTRLALRYVNWCLPESGPLPRALVVWPRPTGWMPG